MSLTARVSSTSHYTLPLASRSCYLPSLVPTPSLRGPFAVCRRIRFMVFNVENYPNMVRLFEELGVGAEKTDMSFR